MLRAIRDVRRGARLPVVARAADDAEARAGDDVDRLLAVHVTPRARARGNLGFDERGALRRESGGSADEHRGACILRRRGPLELATPRDDRTTPHPRLELRALAQPSAVEVAHRPMVWRDERSVARGDGALTLPARRDGSAVLPHPLRSVLEVHHAVVAEELEQSVLRRQHDEGLAAGVELLMNGVLRDVEQVAGGELPARRLLRDPRVITVIDLGLDVPLEAVAAARDDVDRLVGHVPVLPRAAGGRDLLLIEVEAVRPGVRSLLIEDPAHPAIARDLPHGVRGLDDLLLGFPPRTPELRPLLPRTER